MTQQSAEKDGENMQDILDIAEREEEMIGGTENGNGIDIKS